MNELEVKCRLSSKQVKDQQLFYWKQFKCPFVIACGEVDPLCSECVQPPIGRGTEWGAWDLAGRHCKPRPGASHWRRENQWQTDAGRLRGGRAADYWQNPYDWPSPSWRRRMRCTLLHRRRGSARGCSDRGPAAAPWPETPWRGRWRLGTCTGSGRGLRQRPGRTPRRSCSERPRRLEGTSAGAAKMSHCANAPEMKKPQAEPKMKHH